MEGIKKMDGVLCCNCHAGLLECQRHVFERGHILQCGCFDFDTFMLRALNKCRTVLISIDGFSMLPFISLHNRTAAINNQMNEFGYLDPIIKSPNPCAAHTIMLY